MDQSIDAIVITLSKGRVQIIKMEIYDGICHEGGGVETGLECHIPILKNDFF